ncbi:hypothetical protein ACFCX4_13655 [Kitasatospora sp. NPDC056327]|uniref:hypothetical protein n=1 Tax=Kitasatospora sp. NPDC056327 TaxID=3345785 RepID=UPI0035E08F40
MDATERTEAAVPAEAAGATEAAGVAGVAGTVPGGADGGRRRRSGRTWALAGGALVVLAAAVTGGVVLVGGDEPPVVQQTLCGFRRAAGTPLNTLMPKGKVGVEDRRTSLGEDGSPGVRSCWIRVDGEEGLAVQLTSQAADEMETLGDWTARELAERGIVRTWGTAAGMVLCPSDPDRVAVVSVTLHPAMYPEKPGEGLVAEWTRLLGELAEQVRAEQLSEVCA